MLLCAYFQDQNTNFTWKLIADNPLFEDVTVDVKLITKDVMNEIIRTCYSGECTGRKLNFRVNFIGAKTELREMVPQEDYSKLKYTGCDFTLDVP